MHPRCVQKTRIKFVNEISASSRRKAFVSSIDGSRGRLKEIHKMALGMTIHLVYVLSSIWSAPSFMMRRARAASSSPVGGEPVDVARGAATINAQPPRVQTTVAAGSPSKTCPGARTRQLVNSCESS
eukprot:6182982-Pleurochrysis_carterae.AAC.3